MEAAVARTRPAAGTDCGTCSQGSRPGRAAAAGGRRGRGRGRRGWPAGTGWRGRMSGRRSATAPPVTPAAVPAGAAPQDGVPAGRVQAVPAAPGRRGARSSDRPAECSLQHREEPSHREKQHCNTTGDEQVSAAAVGKQNTVTSCRQVLAGQTR